MDCRRRCARCGTDPSFASLVDKQTGYTTRSLICVPLRGHERILSEGGHDEVDEVFEGLLFLRAVAAPERPEHGLSALDAGDPEQVLEAVLVERVALDVEEDVAFGGLGEEAEEVQPAK